MNVLSEIRFAFRSLIRRPGPSLIVTATLALALGANAAIFAVIDALAIRPFPFHGVDRLVVLAETDPVGGFIQESVSPANFIDLKAQARTVERLAAMEWWDVNLVGRDEPERVQGFFVSADLFPALGIEAHLGRTFTADDEVPGRHRRVVLGHGLWTRRFAADPTIVGRAILLDGVPYDVAGIAPAGFDFPLGSQIWAPLSFDASTSVNRGSRYLTIVGRLAPGRTLDDAKAEMAVVASRLQQQYPETNRQRDVYVHSFTRGMMDKGLGSILLLWQAAALFVLLIACANVANLLLARGVDRQRELAVRMAIGAGRGRIVRQLLIESLLLAIAAVPFALLVARGSLDLIRTSMPPNIARFVAGWQTLDLDGRLVLFTIGLGLVTAAVFGALPSLHTSRLGLVDALKDGGRGSSTGAGRMRWRRGLVIAEIALVLPLLAATSLSALAAYRFVNGPQGFDPAHLLVMKVVLPDSRYPDRDARLRFARATVERLAATPGVRSAAAANTLPSTAGNLSRAIEIEGSPIVDRANLPMVDARSITRGYFDVLRIPVVRGRVFDDGDRPDGLPVAIVSASMARRFWPDADPIGRRLRVVTAETGPWLTVVAVSGDVIHDWFTRRFTPTMYQPYAQAPTGAIGFAVRSDGEPASLTTAARDAIHAVDPAQPVFDVKTMVRSLHERTIGIQYVTGIMAVFGILALVLALVGVYGVMAYLVSQRTHEIGVRVALGASARDVRRLVMGQAWRMTAAGTGVGLALAVALSRLIEAGLLGVVSSDIRLLAGIAGLLVVVGVLAGYLPARRATSIDPIIALRDS